jgi:hypothetical protein
MNLVKKSFLSVSVLSTYLVNDRNTMYEFDQKIVSLSLSTQYLFGSWQKYVGIWS